MRALPTNPNRERELRFIRLVAKGVPYCVAARAAGYHWDYGRKLAKGRLKGEIDAHRRRYARYGTKVGFQDAARLAETVLVPR